MPASRGECGSCTVLQAEDRSIVTVEGIGGPGDGQPLSRLQAALVGAGAVQCGFCTPGLVVAIHDLLEHDPNPSDDDIREALAGNLCRCTCYQQIVEAVRMTAGGGGP